MVVTIAYRDKPDEVLYRFLKAGDSVCIGRDKRKCGITLDVNAQGVSRVHLKLELQRNGLLIARDMSTYGTGYDGGPYIVEKEKELKSDTVLQIGIFFFIIKEHDNEEKHVKEVTKSASLGTLEVSSRKRTIPRKAAVVVEEFNAKKRKTHSCAADKMAPEMEFLLNGTTRSTKDATLDAKLGTKQKQNLTEDCQQGTSKVSPLNTVDSSRRSPIGTRILLREARREARKTNNDSVRGTVDETHFPSSSNPVSPERTSNKRTAKEADSSLKEFALLKDELGDTDTVFVLAGAKKDGIVEDIDLEKLQRPLFSSTQLPSSNDINEGPVVEEGSTRFCDRYESADDLFESEEVEEKTTKRSCRRPSKTAVPRRRNSEDSASLNVSKNADKQKVTATASITSWLHRGNSSKRCSQHGDHSESDETPVTAKRPKMETMEGNDETKEEQKKESSDESDMENEKNDSDVDNLTLGMDIETLRMKLKKTVQFEDLKRPTTLTENGSKLNISSCTVDDSQEVNYKRFRKAAQGLHNDNSPLRCAMTQIVGTADLIDYRQLR